MPGSTSMKSGEFSPWGKWACLQLSKSRSLRVTPLHHSKKIMAGAFFMPAAEAKVRKQSFFGISFASGINLVMGLRVIHIIEMLLEVLTGPR